MRLQDMVEGHKQCCICGEFIPFADLYTDSEGTWDMCIPCGTKEANISFSRSKK